MQDMDLVIKKQKFSIENDKKPLIMPTGGTYILCHILFFLLGICHFLPMTIFTAANNFWLYKFGDTSKDTDATDRTYLQKSYASIFTLTNCLVSFVFGVFSMTYGYRMRIMPRIIVTLAIYVVVFVLLTISAVVDSDSWQILFYSLVVTSYGILSGALTVNVVSGLTLFPRFPDEFMKTCLIGEGASGNTADILNILSIIIFNGDIVKSTLLYFTFGTAFVTVTLVLALVMSRMEFFRHNMDSLPVKDASSLPTKSELFVIVKKIKVGLFTVLTTVISVTAAHTSITALVVSEDDSSSLWAKSYFSPVMTFAWANLCGLTGRIISSYVPFKMSNRGLCIFAFTKTLILVPMLWFCNAQPRNHLPVLFGHDWQYGIIIGLFMMALMYCECETNLRIRRLVGPDEVDIAYTIIVLGGNIYQAIFSPVGLFIVNIL